MKRFLFILGIVVVATAIFIGGILLGTQLDFLNTIVFSSALADDISRGSERLVVIDYLDEGKVDDAKSFLNLQLNVTIVGMRAILPSVPEGQSKTTALNFLARIARHRKKYPLNVSQNFKQFRDEDANSTVEKALADALTEVEKREKQNKPLERAR